MLNFLKRHFVWHKVGWMALEVYNPNGPNYQTIVTFRMTASGRRKLKPFINSGAARKAMYRKIDFVLWLEGGDFPKDFKPYEDSVRNFLVKLVDEKMKGE